MSKQITTGPHKIAKGKIFVTLFRADASKMGELYPWTAIKLFIRKKYRANAIFSFCCPILIVSS
jgi:hypothetical protein